MSNSRWFWTDERVELVRKMAAEDVHAGAIGEALGKSIGSILTLCGHRAIDVIKYTPEQQAVYDERAKEREGRRQARKVAANKQAKLDGRLAAMSRSGHSAVTVAAAASRTSVGYRNHMPPAPDMSKDQLRAMLAEAVRNTAEMAV